MVNHKHLYIAIHKEGENNHLKIFKHLICQLSNTKILNSMQITHMQDILSYRVELCQKLENAHRDSPGFQGSPNACDIIYEKVW